MKGDFSRSTYRPKNHYSSVRLQQGRVLLDAEWNEQADVASSTSTGRRRLTLSGPSWCSQAPADQLRAFPRAPRRRAARTCPSRRAGSTSTASLCENDDANGVLYTKQADLPGAALPSTNGSYAVYLDVWERHLTAVDQYGDAFPSLLKRRCRGRTPRPARAWCGR